MYDPDAPTGSGWWHWLVFDLPTDTKELAAGAGIINSKKLPKASIIAYYERKAKTEATMMMQNEKN